jgi:hypothetical protein
MNLHGKKDHIILQEEDKNISKCDTTSQYHILLIIDQHRNWVIHVTSSPILNFNNYEDSVFWDVMLCHWVIDFPRSFKELGNTSPASEQNIIEDLHP